jgi:hypothetical protein
MSRYLCALFSLLLAVVCRAEDPLSHTARWPDTVMQARAAGVDYRSAVERARRGEASALATVFGVTSDMDGSGMTSHCSVLRLLMESLGDGRFSAALAKQNHGVRNRVIQALDFDFGRPWKRHFPLTYSLGRHDLRLLSEHKNT